MWMRENIHNTKMAEDKIALRLSGSFSTINKKDINIQFIETAMGQTLTLSNLEKADLRRGPSVPGGKCNI